MEKATRAELIAALVTDKYSGFKDGDEAILEACADARLEEFRVASDGRRSEVSARTKLETDFRNVSARLKISEERIRTAEAEMSEEEFLQRAPASIKTLVEAHKAQESAARASLVSQLKDLGAMSEDELKKKSIDELKTLASYARVEVPDFSGRGLPVERTASDRVSYAPPDPYAAGLKSLQSKAVN
jgi:predicted  nucleic acid-binding Zn-ribbon protein